MTPLRTCIGCRRARSKDSLLRLVRGADGVVRTDLRGTTPGRGAYVCEDPTCLERALKQACFAYAFRKPCSVRLGLAEEVRELWRQRRSK